MSIKKFFMTDKFIQFNLYYNKFKKPLFNYVNKMVRNKMETEDIVQNVFISLYKNINKIRNKESISFWIFKSARNEVYGYFRKLNHKNIVDFNENQDDNLDFSKNEIINNEFDLSFDKNKVEEQIEYKEIKELIENELNKMNKEIKEIFILRELSGLSYKEIANLFGISEELVKSRLYETRKKLREKISKYI